MRTICPYCDYGYPDEPLDTKILKRLAKPEIPTEDFMLFTERLVTTMDLKSYNGMKVHIGRMHKGKPTDPQYELNKVEDKIINSKHPKVAKT